MTDVFSDTQFNLFVVSLSIIAFVIALFLKKKKKIKNYFIVLCVPIIMYGWKWYSISYHINGNITEKNSQTQSVSKFKSNESIIEKSSESGSTFDTLSSSMLSQPFSLKTSET